MNQRKTPDIRMGKFSRSVFSLNNRLKEDQLDRGCSKKWAALVACVYKMFWNYFKKAVKSDLCRYEFDAIWIKVKCTLVQALRFCTGPTAHRGNGGIALSFHYHGTRRGCWVSITPRPCFSPGKDPVNIVQLAG